MINFADRHYKLPVKLLIAAVFAAIVIISQTGCGSKAAEPVSQSGYYLNTTCEISLYDMDESVAGGVLQLAFDRIESYEKILSKTVKDSDVYLINNAAGEFVTVRPETLEVLEMAGEMSKASDGKFDVTIGGVSGMWDFTGDDPHVPKAEAIEEAIGHVDYENIEINGDKVRLTDEQCQIDLGGIAKGYIADSVARLLEQEGAEHAIVNLGGNVVTIGGKTEAVPFVIGIERPYSDRTAIIGSVKSMDQTLVTSGIYERNFTEDGKLYHHVLDPDTGYPVETDLEAVTIIADKGNSGFCDGLSTTCLIMGLDKAKTMIKNMQEEHPEMHIQAVFIDKDDNVTQTDGLELTLTED